MFMAAGVIYTVLGHDRIAGLAGVARALPTSVLAFALGGAALMGLPPSGAYLAKKLLFEAVAETGQWWWELVIQIGGFFTASYVLLVLAHALWPAADPVKLQAPIPRLQEAASLALALCSMLLGLAAVGAAPSHGLGLAPKDLWSALLVVIGGGLLIIGLVPQLPPVGARDGASANPIRGATIAVGEFLDAVDGVLRQWPVACLALLLLALAFAAMMLS
jgi:NADH:ubiquinone oxidoreductase subunit 5 (subunit L)/multisubunit Na+/H+ antiporter MnhA subunit